MNLFFFFCAFGMIYTLICVLLLRNPVLSVISLIGFFLNGAALLFFFQAEYLGIVYIVVYIGAIAVLFLFVVMMLDFKSGSSLYDVNTEYFLSSFFFLILFFFYLYTFFVNQISFFEASNFSNSTYFYKSWIYLLNSFTDIASIGFVLYSYYMVYFFLCGLLLFVAMVGAIILTLFKRESVRMQNLSDQILRSPKASVHLYTNK